MSKLSTEQFLQELKTRDIRIWLKNGRLFVNAPKGTVSAALQEELKQRKEELIVFFETAIKGADELLPPIPRQPHNHVLPLSFGQQRIWMLHEFNKELVSHYDTLMRSLRIRGNLDVDVLRRSLSEIVRRHKVLRTTFHMSDTEPVQVIAPAGPLPLNEIDLRDLVEGERQDRVEQLLDEAKNTLFDLERGPLFRASLIRLDDTDWILVILLHHIIFDAWSLGILTRELALLYEDFAEDRESSLPELPIQYGDFAVWQRQWLQGEVLATHLDYWRRQLAGMATQELPVDHSRPAVQTYSGACESLVVDTEVAAELIRLSKANGVTSFMTMLTALSVLLFRYTGQPDVTIGTPVTNRDQEELQNLIGFFLNTLVMRVDLSGDPTFNDVLMQVRRTVLDAFAHQHLPFEVLVDKLKVERDTSRSPLFQVLFVLQNVSEMAPLQFRNLDISPVEETADTTRFDLEFYVYQEDAGFSLSCLYNTDLFAAETIQRILVHFTNLLGAIAGKPGQPLSSLSLLGADERHKILYEWNPPQDDYPAADCLHRLLERQASLTPHAIAVEFSDQSLSYGELDQRANQLAHYLRETGIDTGGLVGVFMERSLEMVVTLYGIIKAGGAFVPLDPDYPQDRIAFMLNDTRLAVVVTQQHLQQRLSSCAVQLLCMDSQWPLIAERDINSLPDTVTLSDPAYVIYTSGSTGRPKGVVNCHAGIVNRLLWGQDVYQLQADDCVLQKTPYSFDVSIWEFFWPLICGARLVVAKAGGHNDPDYLAKVIARHNITTLHFVPSMLRAYLEQQNGRFADCVRRVMCSGEELTCELQDKFFKLNNADLHNLYGPTEAAIEVTSWHCRRNDHRRAVPIGKPVANTQIYILDSHLQPVPIGIVGELHIAGIQVAHSYLNRPELTRDKFIADPFSTVPGARMYKTGDMARYLPDGNIEYLGRMDNQVKLRGFRIELGEVESVLVEHPDVQVAVVIVREDTPGDQRLVAYAVSATGRQIPTAGIRTFMRARVPDYMLPSNLIWLDKIPLTVSGKIDRKSLPLPVHTVDRHATVVTEPAGELETVMVRIWEDLLEIDDIRPLDSFFDLGGHSLLSIKVVERFERETGIRFSPNDLISQTLRQVVHGIEPRVSPAVGSVKPGLLDRLTGWRKHFQRSGVVGSYQTPWLLSPRPNAKATVRLFCFAFAGGSASTYYSWPNAFPPQVEILALQLPGRDSRFSEPRITCARQLASHITDAITPLLDRSFAFFGYSTGALVAFETARELRRREQPLPHQLHVAAARAPQAGTLVPKLAQLPHDEFIERIRYYFQPSEEAWQDPELLDSLIRILRDDMLINEDYTYTDEPPLSCDIDVYLGGEDRSVLVEQAMAWAGQTSGVFSSTEFSGNHFFLNTHLAGLQAKVRGRLAGIAG